MAKPNDDTGKTSETVGYPPEKLKEFEAWLHQARQRILKGYDDQKAEIDGFKGDTESDAYDDASNIVEMNILMALNDTQKKELSQIGLALLKVKDGTYGICEGCGELIGEQRLKFLPFANLCVKCKDKEERGTVVIQRDAHIVPPDEDFLVLTDSDEDY